MKKFYKQSSSAQNSHAFGTIVISDHIYTPANLATH